MNDLLIHKMTRSELLAHIQRIQPAMDYWKGRCDDLEADNKQLRAQNTGMLMGSVTQLAKDIIVRSDTPDIPKAIATGLEFARACRDILSEIPEAQDPVVDEQGPAGPDGAEVVGVLPDPSTERTN